MAAEELQLLQQLDAALTQEAHEKVKGLCHKLLQLNPADPDVNRVLAVSLLHQAEYDELEKLMNGPLKKIFADMLLEHSYMLYRRNQLPEALVVLQRIKEPSVFVRHLEAQIRYKSGDYAGALRIYQTFPVGPDMDPELQANILAAYVGAGDTAGALAFLDQLQTSFGGGGGSGGDLSYEASYNLACALIEAARFAEAGRQLRQAADLCQRSLTEDGYEPEEIADELAVIAVQQAYVEQRLGNLDPAERGYLRLLKQSPLSDKVVLAVAANNLVSLPSHQNRKIFNSLRRIDQAAEVPAHRLLPGQRRTVLLNRALLQLQGKKKQECLQAAETLAREFPEDEAPVLIKAALAFQSQPAKCLDLLNDRIRVHPKNSLGCRLALAQLPLLKGDFRAAIAELQKLAAAEPSLAGHAGVTAALVALHEQVGDIEAASALLRDSVETAADSDTRLVLRSKQATLQLKTAGSEAAGLQQYQELVQEAVAESQLRKQLLVQFLEAAVATAQPAVALRSVASQIPALPASELGSVDADKIESEANINLIQYLQKKKLKEDADHAVRLTKAGQVLSRDHRQDVVREGAEASDQSGGKPGQPQDKQQQQQLKKKKRKIRYPKGFDPANPGPMPDPERWLPRWERTRQPKKGRRRGANQPMSTGAQGALPTASDPVEFQPTASSASLPASTAGASRNKKAKGKKGKGW